MDTLPETAAVAVDGRMVLDSLKPAALRQTRRRKNGNLGSEPRTRSPCAMDTAPETAAVAIDGRMVLDSLKAAALRQTRRRKIGRVNTTQLASSPPTNSQVLQHFLTQKPALHDAH